MATTVQELKRDNIDPDPNQPRKIFNERKLVDLAQDISVNGVIQALVVRPHPKTKGRYMVVFGERRWRAARMVELATLPCVVRDINDQTALVLQMAENTQRDDMHPLEEADGYRVMQKRDGRDVDEIAAITGRTRAYIYNALKLCELGADGRAAFLAGRLDKSRALLIARLPAALHKQAVEEIADRVDADPVSYRDAAHHIRRNYMLRLADAPFKPGDGLLVQKAGPCTTCPKRTGNQQELFADVLTEKGGADICTDAKCFNEKVDAHWQRVKNELAARGRRVIEGQAATAAGGYGDKQLLDLDRDADEIGEYNKTWRQVLGKHAEPVAVARDPSTNRIKELISRSDLPALMKDAGVKSKKKDESEKDAAFEASQAEEKERRRVRELVNDCIRANILIKVADLEQVDLWRLLARMTVRVCRNDAHRAVLRLHAIEVVKEYTPKATLLALIGDEKHAADLRDIVLQLLLAESHAWAESDEEEELTPEEAKERQEFMGNMEDAAQFLGVDVPAIVKKVRADMAAAAEKKKAPKARNGTPKPPKEVAP